MNRINSILTIAILLSTQAVSAETATTFTGKSWSTFPGGAKAVCADSDIDNDNDRLIEVCSLEMLNAMRWQLDGSGLQTTERATKITTGCGGDGCIGYEMVRDLDFRNDDSYSAPDENKTRWTTGAGWESVGSVSNSFNAIFEGNGHTLSHLMINSQLSDQGLFTRSRGVINGIGLLAVDLHVGRRAGSLVGRHNGTISNSYVTGKVVSPVAIIGGLVGWSGLSGRGTIYNCYSKAKILVPGGFSVGGLVGDSPGPVNNSYSTGQVSGTSQVGGLVGSGGGTISNSYSIGRVPKTSASGGLTSPDARNATNSYWDIDKSKVTTSGAGTSKTTVELKAPTAPGQTTDDTYFGWSTDDWDFGAENQYPAIKYNTDADADYQTCSTSQQPPCGDLLPRQRPIFVRIKVYIEGALE